jgi:hypothetical protein
MKPKYMKLSYKLLSLLILLNFVYGISIGQNALKNQPTAVPFLLITPDAKSAGMANVNLGISASTNDLFQNAAKLALMNEKSGFTLNYTPWLKDIGLENVYILTSGYYKKINNSSAYHVSLKYFTLGTGIKYNVMNFNFSYLVPSGSGTAGGTSPLANTIRFGISFDLDPEETK